MTGKKTREPGSTDQKAHGWERLTWDDLRAWAGRRDLDKGRSYTRRVNQLQVTEDGRLLAWVTGTQRYATTARLTPTGIPTSKCTCPLQIDGCKHGVALVLAFLDILKQKKSVPTASDDDSRWTALNYVSKVPKYDFDNDMADEFQEDFEDEDSDEDEHFEWSSRIQRQPDQHSSSKARKSATELREFLRSKSADELVEMLMDCAERHVEFRESLQEQQAIVDGKVGKLIQAARHEIERATAEPDWDDSWDDDSDSSLPSYDGVKRRLQTLLNAGQADAVVELGRVLIASALGQVGEAYDEGDMGQTLADSLDIVFEALMKSSLAPHEKILFAFDALKHDDYGILDQVDVLIDHDWSCQDWSLVADEFASRLRTPSSTKEDSTRSYLRDQLSGWLILALEKAGRADEVLPLCESEARTSGNYERLVKRLLDAKQWDDAERWAREGIANAPSHLDGVVRNLKDTLRGIAEQRKNWPLVAAFFAEAFFEHPDVESFEELVEAAQKADCGDQVEAAARNFLETGIRPDATVDSSRQEEPRRQARVRMKKNGKPKDTVTTPQHSLSPWPLPSLDLPEPRGARERREVPESPRCHLDVLLELALKANRPDEILLWFDSISRTANGHGLFGNRIADEVATAVASTHSDRSLKLWMRLIDAEIATTTPAHYEIAAGYLRKVRDLLANLDRRAEWNEYLAGLRETHRRKKRLVEILDGMTGRPIVSS